MFIRFCGYLKPQIEVMMPVVKMTLELKGENIAEEANSLLIFPESGGPQTVQAVEVTLLSNEDLNPDKIISLSELLQTHIILRDPYMHACRGCKC